MDSVNDLLSDPLKGTKRAQGVLCYLFREVLLWRKMNRFTWGRLLNNYFQKPHNQVRPDKGNLNKVLIADDMNWQAFCKAVDFLNPHKAFLDIKLHWKDGTTSDYRIEINPSDPENFIGWDQCELFERAKPATLLMAQIFRHIASIESAKHPDRQVWWDKLFEDYTKNPANVVGMTQTEINKDVQGLKRSIVDPRLSWNGFRKGLHLLRPKAEEYTLTLQWADNPELRKTLPDSVHPIYIADPYFVE